MDDEWVKAKLLKTLVPYNENMVMNLHARADYTTMSSNDILAQFVTYDTLKATSKSSINQPRVTKNLTLKAHVSEHPRYVESTSAYSTDDFEGELSEVLCCAANNYWKGKGVKVNGPPFIKRMCFNCGKENHLARDCPYERRETQGGQLILKKNKSVPRAFIKRAPQKALVITKHEEYESRGE